MELSFLFRQRDRCRHAGLPKPTIFKVEVSETQRGLQLERMSSLRVALVIRFPPIDFFLSQVVNAGPRRFYYFIVFARQHSADVVFANQNQLIITYRELVRRTPTLWIAVESAMFRKNKGSVPDLKRDFTSPVKWPHLRPKGDFVRAAMLPIKDHDFLIILGFAAEKNGRVWDFVSV